MDVSESQGYWCSPQHAIEVLQKEVQRLRAERRWIPVSERLPKDGERVIAYFPEETESVGEATFRLTEENQWLTEHGSWFLVTHWMPLPEPPRMAT